MRWAIRYTVMAAISKVRDLFRWVCFQHKDIRLRAARIPSTLVMVTARSWEEKSSPKEAARIPTPASICPRRPMPLAGGFFRMTQAGLGGKQNSSTITATVSTKERIWAGWVTERRFLPSSPVAKSQIRRRSPRKPAPRGSQG